MENIVNIKIRVRGFIVGCLIFVNALNGDSFEGIVSYRIKDHFGREATALFYVNSEEIRQELEIEEGRILVTQINFKERKKTTAWKDGWVIAEADLSQFDEDSEFAEKLLEKDFHLDLFEGGFDFYTLDKKVAFSAEFGSEEFPSDFLRFFEIVRIFGISERGQMFVPKVFEFQIGDMFGEFTLESVERISLSSETFSLPPPPGEDNQIQFEISDLHPPTRPAKPKVSEDESTRQP